MDNSLNSTTTDISMPTSNYQSNKDNQLLHDKDPNTNTTDVTSFLELIAPDGAVTLAAISAEVGPPICCTVDSWDDDRIEDWINQESQSNLYFHVNHSTRVSDAKLKKGDIDEIRAFHVDIDPSEIGDDEGWRNGVLERLREFDPKPTCVVNSGNGYHAYWLLREPLEGDEAKQSVATVEAINLGLANALGGDKCHNIDRIMRLPGTVNWPSAKKLKKGRTACEAHIVDNLTDCERTYEIGDLQAFESVPAVNTKHRAVSDTNGGRGQKSEPTNGEAPDLDAPINPSDSDRPSEAIIKQLKSGLKHLVFHGEAKDDPARYESRSEATFGAILGLHHAGCSNSEICAIVSAPENSISESYLEAKDKGVRKLHRDVRKAYEWIQENDWSVKLSIKWPDGKVDGTGMPRSTYRNTHEALKFVGCDLEFDDMQKAVFVNFGDSPPDEAPTMKGRSKYDDDASIQLKHIIGNRFGFRPKKDDFEEALRKHALDNPVHAVQDYMDSLQWDGTGRLDHLLSTYFGAEESPLNTALSRIMLTSMVARTYKPGTKFDLMIVLEGEQGSGKSTSLRILAGDDHFNDQPIVQVNDPQKVLEQTQGVMVYEVAELVMNRKADVEAMKAFITRQTDKARKAYGRHPEEVPRSFVLIGTTNETEYLTDKTGNRRFAPVRTGTIDLEALQADRDQLFAEAKVAYDNGQKLYLEDDLLKALEERQTEAVETDPWEDVLAKIKPTKSDCGKFYYVTNEGIYEALGIEAKGRFAGAQGKRIKAIMVGLGWVPAKKNIGGRSTRIYHRPDDPTAFGATSRQSSSKWQESALKKLKF